MSTRASIVSVVVGLVGLAGAGTLFALSQMVETTRLERAVELLQILQQLDSQWSVEVLQVSADPLADFDGLAAISPEVRRHARELRDLARKDPEIPPELKAPLLSYVSRLDSKEERIERFKSGYAIVRNSQRYLPLAVQLVAAKAAEFEQDDLGEVIRTQHEVLENYFANPSAIDKQQILLSLDSLRVQRSQYPAAVGSALGNFLAHALVLLEQKEPLDELRTTATSLEATGVAQGLTTELSDLIQAREAEGARYQQLSFGLALVVLIGLTVFFALTRRATPAAASQVVAAVDSTLDLSSDALHLYDDLPDTDEATATQAPSDPTEQIHTEYLLQVVRAGGKRLGSHMGLLSEVYVEISKSLGESQSALNDEGAPTGSKTSFGEVNDILRAKSVPKLLQAMRRSVQTVDRASEGFHTSMQHLIEKKLAPLSTLTGSTDELTAAIGCVVTNAVESFAGTEETGVIRIQTVEDQNSVSITVTDNGPGMDQKTGQAAFVAFFSTKEEHRGLGLSAAQYAVRKHGGLIKLNSVPGKGTAVRLLLPIDGVAAA